MEAGKPNPGSSYKLVVSNAKINTFNVARVPELKVTNPQSVNLIDATKLSEPNPSGMKKSRSIFPFTQEPGKIFKLSAKQEGKQVTYTGKYQGEVDQQKTSYYLALQKDKDGTKYTVMPVKSWYAFQKDANIKVLDLDAAEAIMEPRKKKKEEKKGDKKVVKKSEESESEGSDEVVDDQPKKRSRKGKNITHEKYEEYVDNIEGMDYNEKEEFQDDDEKNVDEEEGGEEEEKLAKKKKLTTRGFDLEQLIDKKEKEKVKEKTQAIAEEISEEEGSISEDENEEEEDSVESEGDEAVPAKKKKEDGDEEDKEQS